MRSGNFLKAIDKLQEPIRIKHEPSAENSDDVSEVAVQDLSTSLEVLKPAYKKTRRYATGFSY
jgi:hypothetical protein